MDSWRQSWIFLTQLQTSDRALERVADLVSDTSSQTTQTCELLMEEQAAL
jgi:hypothetical protein